MAEKQGFLHRIRGNAEWEAIRWAWPAGRSALIAACYGGLQRLRHVHVDWVGTGILFFLIMVLGYLLRKRSPSISVDPKVEQTTPPKNSPSKEELEIYAEQNRWHEWANNHNLTHYYNLGVKAEHLFSPLQMEAFQLAKELGRLLETLPSVTELNQDDFAHNAQGVADYLMAHQAAWEPREKAFAMIRARYAHSLGARVRDVVLRLRIEGFGSDSWIDQWFDDAPNELYLKPIQDTLVAMAHEVNGIKLSVTTYPRNV